MIKGESSKNFDCHTRVWFQNLGRGQKYIDQKSGLQDADWNVHVTYNVKHNNECGSKAWHNAKTFEKH